jgi:cupin 2 domain-containing protein
MPEEDLIRFLEKVAQLQDLVQSLDGHPDRREQLACCASHNEVVMLSKAWGYDIGRRWGEQPAASELSPGNLDHGLIRMTMSG